MVPVRGQRVGQRADPRLQPGDVVATGGHSMLAWRSASLELLAVSRSSSLTGRTGQFRVVGQRPARNSGISRVELLPWSSHAVI